MINIAEYDNFVFDLYGTLIDIHTDEQAILTWERWTKVLKERGLKTEAPEVMRGTFFRADAAARIKALEEWGFAFPEIDVIPIYEEMFLSYGNPKEMLDARLLNEAGYAFRTASREYMRLFPGVEDFLKGLKKAGKKVYILSNAQRCYTWPEICEFGLERICDDILISSDERCMKPDRAFFDALADKHGFDRSRTVMFGDSRVNDYEGALNAGWNAVHLAGENAPDRYYTFCPPGTREEPK